MSVERAGAVAAAVATAAVVIALLVVARQVAPRRQPTTPWPSVPDSVFGYHGEPAEDPAEDDLPPLAYCRACHELVGFDDMGDGRWLCRLAGHINEEINP